MRQLPEQQGASSEVIRHICEPRFTVVKLVISNPLTKITLKVIQERLCHRGSLMVILTFSKYILATQKISTKVWVINKNAIDGNLGSGNCCLRCDTGLSDQCPNGKNGGQCGDHGDNQIDSLE